MQVFSKCQYPLKRAGLAINHLKGNVPGAGINSKYSVGKVLPGNRVSLAKLSSLSSLVCITAKIELFSFPPPLFQSSLLDFVAAQTQQSSALRRTIKPAKLMQKKKKLNTHTQHTQNHSGRHGHMEVFNKYVHVALGDMV